METHRARSHIPTPVIGGDAVPVVIRRHRWQGFLTFPLTEEEAADLSAKVAAGGPDVHASVEYTVTVLQPTCVTCGKEFPVAAPSCPGVMDGT
jgi:hypothetical protein